MVEPVGRNSGPPNILIFGENHMGRVVDPLIALECAVKLRINIGMEPRNMILATELTPSEAEKYNKSLVGATFKLKSGEKFKVAVIGLEATGINPTHGDVTEKVYNWMLDAIKPKFKTVKEVVALAEGKYICCDDIKELSEFKKMTITNRINAINQLDSIISGGLVEVTSSWPRTKEAQDLEQIYMSSIEQDRQTKSRQKEPQEYLPCSPWVNIFCASAKIREEENKHWAARLETLAKGLPSSEIDIVVILGNAHVVGMGITPDVGKILIENSKLLKDKQLFAKIISIPLPLDLQSGYDTQTKKSYDPMISVPSKKEEIFSPLVPKEEAKKASKPVFHGSGTTTEPKKDSQKKEVKEYPELKK